MNGHRLLPLLIFGLVTFYAVPAWAPHIPDHPGRLLVAFAPGGNADRVARILANAVSKSLNAPIIVENRPGAGGRIGVQSLSDATPDGSVMLLTPSFPMTLFPAIDRRLNYDPARDFAPVSQLGTFAFGIAVSRDARFQNIGELVAGAKSQPDNIKLGVAGLNTVPHILGAVLSQAAGIRLQVIPFQGSQPALQAVIAGQTSLAIAPLESLEGLQRSGAVRVLAVTGTQRSPAMPDVPTLREAGFDVAIDDWYGVFVPARTPPRVIERLNSAFVSAVRSAEVQQQLMAAGLKPTGTSPARLAEIRSADARFWQAAFARSGLERQ